MKPTAHQSGAHDQNRTGDLVLTKDVLCQLSYIGLRACGASADKSAVPHLIAPPNRPRCASVLRPDRPPCASSLLSNRRLTSRRASSVAFQPNHRGPGLACAPKHAGGSYGRRLERETGIEPATNSLEGCDSTTELLPPASSPPSAFRPRVTVSTRLTACTLRRLTRYLAATAGTFPARAYRLLDLPPAANCDTRDARAQSAPCPLTNLAPARLLRAPLIQPAIHRPSTRQNVRWWRGKESNLRSPRATDLQSAAFDRFATSPAVCVLGIVSFLTVTCGPERPIVGAGEGI